MFYAARLKLTGWYVLIIMCISFLFSSAIYIRLAREIDRLVVIQHSRALMLPPSFVRQRLDTDLFQEIKARAIANLLAVNGGIFIVTGLASHFLAGRTLRPIEEMVEEQNRFTADASHELRTPLTALKTEIEVALRDKNLSSDQSKALLKSNLEEVNKLRQLAEELLVFAEHGPKSASPQFTSVSIPEVIHQAIERVSPLAKEKAIHIVTHTNESTIKGQEDKLINLFVILLDNAIKFSPDKSEVSVAASPNDGYVQIAIQDRGIGIEKHDLPHIFNRFFRANSARSKHGAGGFGLGLSIAKQIVSQHHGHIAISSDPTNGTTVTIKFPLIQST